MANKRRACTSILVVIMMFISVIATANPFGIWLPVAQASSSPVANAGPDQTVNEGDLVTLNGTGSYDPDGEDITYSWLQTAGLTVSLADNGTPTPSFIAPEIYTSGSTVLTFMLTISDGTNSSTDSVDITINNVPGYHYSPAFSATGSNYFDTQDYPLLRLETFTLAAWFKTTKNYAPLSVKSVIANKGGFGSEDPGKNMNYGIWVENGSTHGNKIGGGFETSSGPDFFVMSPLTYNDGQWHYAVLTYDKSVLKLYIDGTRVASKSTTAIPDTLGNQPVRIGADALEGKRHFTGEIDEERVWNRAVTAQEVADQYNLGLFDKTGLLLHMDGTGNNNTPIADAGPDQTVNEGTTVTLNGAASSDPDGDLLTFSWIQTGGPGVTLSDPTSVMPSFPAPEVAASGATLIFQLAVSDSSGASATDTVNVIVQNINKPPIASAGPDQTVQEGTIVSLNGTGSYDPDNDSLTYSWVQTNGITTELKDRGTATPSFIAPEVDATGATLTFQLTVNDGNGASATDTVDIIVNNELVSPVADAGPDQTVNEGTTVTLDGTGSYDPNGHILLYSWVQSSGTPVVLSNSTSPTPSFTAPEVSSTGATLAFELTVTDNDLLADSDIVNITVNDLNLSPIADAGSDQAVNEGVLVTLNGTNSHDPDSYPQPLTYLWQQVDSSGVSIVLSDSTSPTPSFTAPEISVISIVLAFKLTVSDGATSSTDTVEITINNIAISGYHYSPSYTATGSSFFDIPHHSSQSLDKFTLAAWFKTTKNYAPLSVKSVIANKGGFGSEDPGKNMNYGIWVENGSTHGNKIGGGFETSSGPDFFVMSPLTYNDGQWHYAVLTYDKSVLKLYIDGTRVASKSTTAIPDTLGNQPVRIGADALEGKRHFTGEIDEVRVWNRAISSAEVSDQYQSSLIDTTGLRLHMDGVSYNQFPIVNAGPDQTVTEGDPVTLTSSGTSDPDGNTLTYSWTQTQGPSVTLSNANTLTASFTAPEVNSGGAILTFQLTVSDGKGGVSKDGVDIIVRNINQPPSAKAGPDQEVNEGTETVILRGDDSVDPDGDTLTYLWVQTVGPTVSLDDPNAQNPTFTAPIVAFNTMLSFTLTVSDGIENSTDTANVLIINTAGGYVYSPPFSATGSGSSYYDIPHHSSLSLEKFSLAAWFKTTKNYATATTKALIANKGGFGSESAGKNMNYGIWVDYGSTHGNKIEAGFETSSGPDFFIRSPGTYNDGQWHYAVVTYDRSALRLYIDGVQVAWRPITDMPDNTGNQPLRIGADALEGKRHFTGEIDEVRVWKRALFASEISDQYLSGIFSFEGQLVHMVGLSHDSTPVANAGPDQDVNEGTTVTLNGSGSSDPDGGTTLSYSWVQTAGPTMSLDNPNAQNPSFIAPIVAANVSLTFSLTVSDGILSSTDSVNIKIVNTVGGYRYEPPYILMGDNYFDFPDNSSLRLKKFTVAAWFKTTEQFTKDAIIVNKGGFGSELAGQNLNYGIWIDNTQRVRAGFESQGGFDVFVNSTKSYNDGIVHYVVLTFDELVLNLYIDGELVASKTVSSNVPDVTGNQNVRIGANSLFPDRYFKGQIDEVRIWNRAVSANEASSQYLSGNFDTIGQVLHINMTNVPVANAGSLQVVTELNQTLLNATASFDPDGTPLTYSWIQIFGPSATIQDSGTATPTITVPDVVGEEALIFEVTVTDGQYFAARSVRVIDIDANIKNKILGTPDYMNDIAAEINNATSFVYATMYFVETYSNNKIIDALQNAVNRNVTVKITLAPQSLDLYPTVEEDLAARGIPYKVIFNHAKVVIIDNKTAYLGSANWNKNGLERNWELSMKTNNPDTIAEAYRYVDVLWNSDGNKVVDFNNYHYERFVNGPEYYNLLLEHLRSSKSIKMLMFEMTYNFQDMQAVDSKVLNELRSAHQRGANLQIVLDDPRYHLIYGGKQFLTQNNIPHKLDDKKSGHLERMHAKIFLIDDEILYIGSHNWSRDSLNSAGEASIITRNPQTISDYLTIFNNKWNIAIDP